MTKYHVHLYPVVCVTVGDVEAENPVEAIKKAQELVDLDRLFAGATPGHPHVVSIQYAGDLESFLVDEDGDTEHERSREYDADYLPI